MKWLTKATVLVAMLVSIPTAGCQISHNWQDTQHAAKSREETTVRSNTYSTALPQNVDRSLERDLQTAQDERIQNRSFELAQTRGEGRTLREQENRRSGGTGVAPAPNTVKGGGDSADDGKSGTSTATNPDTNTGVQGGSGRSDTTKGPKIKSQSGSDGDSGGSSGGGGSGR